METIIFDFDGVIADTFRQVMVIASRLAEELGTRKMTPEEIAGLRNKGAKEVFSALGVPVVKLPLWAKRVRKEQAKNIEKVPLFRGMKELFSGLKKKGYCLGILTSNSADNVYKFLIKNNIDLNLFTFIHGEGSYFGKDKILKKLFKKHKLNPQEVIYIGDESRDIQAAKKAGIKIIAVGWGYESKKSLKAYQPDYFVEKPEEILKLFKS